MRVETSLPVLMARLKGQRLFLARPAHWAPVGAQTMFFGAEDEMQRELRALKVPLERVEALPVEVCVHTP